MNNNKTPNQEQLMRSGQFYSEEGFWDKVGKVAKAAGLKVIYMALLLYYTVIASTTPMASRTVIFGALGYFILPIDLIPDLIPIVGYTDDIAALTAVIRTVSSHITPAIKQSAKDQLHRWFGDYDEKEIKDLA